MEWRDPYTAGHQKRVAHIATAIGREMGLDEDRLSGLYLGCMVHDIGKVAVPAEILTKPGKLN
jgi:HD-GYP domain-containing protein (c-di-GMP phosphodiesterase class II)